MKKHGKVDSNQTAIVQALRAAGCLVLSLSALGGGVPDLLVYRRSEMQFHLVEVKDGSKPPSKRKLTPDQVAFHQQWPVKIVTSVDEALQAVGAMK